MAAPVLARAHVGTLRVPRVSVPPSTFLAAWMLLFAQVAVLGGLGGGWRIGVIRVSPLAIACPLALAVAAVVLRGGGPTLLADVTRRPSLWVPLGAGLAGAGAVWCLAPSRLSGWDALGLVTAATFEETVFRLALPVCVWQALRALGRPRAGPVVAAVVAVATFAVMPGHLAQVASPAAMVPFVCLALLLLGVVWIGRDPLLAVAAHLGVNAWMLAATLGAVHATVARAGTAVVVVPLGVALARRTRAHSSP